MSVSQTEAEISKQCVTEYTLNRNEKYNLGVKRVMACLPFLSLLKAAQQLLLSSALRKNKGKGGDQNRSCFSSEYFPLFVGAFS